MGEFLRLIVDILYQEPRAYPFFGYDRMSFLLWWRENVILATDPNVEPLRGCLSIARLVDFFAVFNRYVQKGWGAPYYLQAAICARLKYVKYKMGRAAAKAIARRVKIEFKPHRAMGCWAFCPNLGGVEPRRPYPRASHVPFGMRPLYADPRGFGG